MFLCHITNIKLTKIKVSKQYLKELYMTIFDRNPNPKIQFPTDFFPISDKLQSENNTVNMGKRMRLVDYKISFPMNLN